MIYFANQTIERFKNRVRELTRGHRSQRIEDRIRKLAQYMMGWISYYRLVQTARLIDDLDGWVQSRLRMCLFKQWRKPVTRLRNLRKLGLSDNQSNPFRSGKKYWHLANLSYTKWVLNNQYWQGLGYISLKETWQKYQHAS